MAKVKKKAPKSAARPKPKKKAPTKKKAPPTAKQDTKKTIELLKPTGESSILSQESMKEGIFPPTVFSDAIYTNGIRLFPESCVQDDSPENPRVSLTYNYNYTAPMTEAVRKKLNIPKSIQYFYSNDTVPLLPPPDTKLWLHKRAGKSAVQKHFPMPVFRLLGVITREIIVSNDSPLGPFAVLAKYSPKQVFELDASTHRRITRSAALAEAKAEYNSLGGGSAETHGKKRMAATTKNVKGDKNGLDARAAEIQSRWNQKSAQGRRHKGWDSNGQLPLDVANDEQYVPLPVLKKWLKRKEFVDSSLSHTLLYNGLRSIPNDLETIVASLLELASPEGLFRTPLVLPYCVVELVEEKRVAKPRRKGASKKQKTESVEHKWKISIGVYANRLLPEVMTSHDLHIVMTAMDEGSYRIVEPLHLPPTPPKPVFQSAPTPVVVTDESDVVVMSDSDGEEKKSDDVVDLTIRESTRDESRVSAFSVNGFLKLLESKGNDISNWPAIAPSLSSTLKLELMLHQQHAISWMLQMESLEGYGINSLLWEEREFLDGGRYFYSPALGQIRLVPPPVMKGGILADAMGLGKTLEVLGLIVATLDELKREAAEAAKDCGQDDLLSTHATLIIVPPALVSQWKAEIRKAVGDALVVQSFNQGTLRFESEGADDEDEDPDIVITTYSALSQNPSSRVLCNIAWGRIVLDEMQEIRSSTTKIAKNCDNLSCNRRWMISGTPLFEGIGDLRGELNFLQLEPYAARLEDGFFDFSITSHWEHHSLHGLATLQILGLVILRRSKSMTIAETGQPLLGLKPLTVEFMPVPQDPCERAVYCFLESIVARVLIKGKGDDKRSVASRKQCLRVLREMCVSPVLLSGGMGASSQLSILHRWLVQENRRFAPTRISNGGASAARGPNGSFPFSCHASTLSCDQAIDFLSSSQEVANVGDGFVTSQRLGFGGGVSQRNRASEDVGTMIAQTEEAIHSATKALKKATSERAKARWHLALEMITTGQLAELPSNVNPSFALLWKVRAAVISACDHDGMPALLLRGWRPSPTFQSDLFEEHPDFAWAYPHCYQIDEIPSSVSVREVGNSILSLFREEEDSEMIDADRVTVVEMSSTLESWLAVLQFKDEDDLKLFLRKANSSSGVALITESNPPQLREAIESTKAALEEAEAEYTVLPSAKAKQNRALAKKNHERVLKGLRIVLRSDGSPYLVRASKTLGKLRQKTPHLASDMYETTTNAVKEYNGAISQHAYELENGTARVARLRRRTEHQVPEVVQELNSFEILSALSKGENDKTQCPICLCSIGISFDTYGEEHSALVAMTHCLHIFCADCLKDYAQKGQGIMCCPVCRHTVDQRRPVIIVDTEKTEDQEKLEGRRNEAKSFVQKVAKMLDASNGVLDPSVWFEMYLSIDLPLNADKSRHRHQHAIPGELLAQLRAATGMRMGAPPSDEPVGSVPGAGLSSKVRALLQDLPRNERSVVFGESKSAVEHLKFVLDKSGIGCRALFRGEAISAQTSALQDWQSSVPNPRGNGEQIIPVPVLIVQAGAAACGLTLTAACKMFIMEPFQRMEEEQQAYARCHRYGQEYPVHVKCYYAPVSVESRLLEWRKRASATGDTKIVYSPVAEDEDEEELDEHQQQVLLGEEDEEADNNRTHFLLGLHAHENEQFDD